MANGMVCPECDQQMYAETEEWDEDHRINQGVQSIFSVLIPKISYPDSKMSTSVFQKIIADSKSLSYWFKTNNAEFKIQLMIFQIFGDAVLFCWELYLKCLRTFELLNKGCGYVWWRSYALHKCKVNL